MTIAELRSLASYHEQEAAIRRESWTVLRNANLATWHEEMAKKLTTLADTFEACGRLLTNITGNYP